jgi:hypothetical protein
MADDPDTGETPNLLPADSATATLSALGLLPQLSPPSMQGAVNPDTLQAQAGLGLMNPSADAEQIIPPGLMRPTDDAQVAAAQQAQGGAPVLPPGLPTHGGEAPGPQGIIPQGLIRPGEAQEINGPAPLQSGAPVTPEPTVGPHTGAIQPQPDLPLEQAGQQAMALDRKAMASGAEAGAAKGAADQDRVQHLAHIDATELRDQDRVLGTHQALRELADAKASMDTHQWMTKIDDLIRKEPDPGRMFAGEGGGMRRFMWFASILGNAIANRKHPERANMAMQLLMHEVDQDVALQKDQQSKELQGAKMHLEQTQAERSQAHADLADDRSQKLLRIGTVGRLLRDQAMLPGPLDQKSAKLAAAAALDQKMADEAHGYLKEARETRYKDLDREKDLQLAGIRESAAMAREKYGQGMQNYRQNQQQQFEVGPQKEAFETRKEGRDFVNKALLAPVEAEAKAAGAEKAGNAPLNVNLGLTARDAKGNAAPLVLGKEDRVHAGEVVDVANQEWLALDRIDKQLATMGPTDFLAGNPKFDSAMAAAEAIRAKSLHGGGRVSESFIKLAKTAETGAAGSWQGRALQDVRGQLDEVRGVVKDRIREMPQTVVDEVSPYTKGNEALQWTPPNLQGQAPQAPSLGEVKKAYGAPTSKPVPPQSVKEMNAIDAGKQQAPKLSPQGDTAVQHAVQTFGWHAGGDVATGLLPDDIDAISQAAADNVRRAGLSSDMESGKPIPPGEREDAALRIELEAKRALNDSYEHERNLLKASKPGDVVRLYNFDAFKEAALKEGFVTNDPDSEKSLRRLYDSFHDGDSLDYGKLDKVLKSTEVRYH